MATEIVYKIALWYIPIYLVLLVILSLLLFIKEFKFLIYYVFDKLYLDWNPKVEKPRLFFAGIAYVFIWLAWKLSKLKLWDIWFCTPLSLLTSIIGIAILFMVLTKSFENRFIIYIKKKLNTSNVQAIINTKTHNIESVLKSFTTSIPKSDINTFCDLLSLNRIEEKDKIEWKDSTVNLIRFIFILFGIKADPNNSLDHNGIRPIIEHYFQKGGKSITLTESGSEISNVKKELDSRKGIFVDYEYKVLALFEQNKR